MNGMKRLAVFLVVACAMIAQAETTLDYVQDGLIAHWDGIDNVARGAHDPDTTVWTDLIGGKNWTLRSNATVGENALTFSGTKLALANSTTMTHEDSLAIFGSDGEKTVEIVLMPNGDNVSYCLLQTPTGCGVGFYAYNNYFSFSHMGSDDCMAWSSSDKNIFSTISVGYRDLAVKAICRDGVNAARATTRGYVACANGAVSSATSMATLGGQNNANGFKAVVYALRVYNRLLTAEEMAQNAAVDQARFVDGDYAFSDKLLVTSSKPEAWGAVVTPNYGVATAESKECTAPSTYEASDGTAYVCTGWKLYSYDSSNHQWSTPIAGNGTSCAYEHTVGAYAKLEWQWETEESLQVAELQSAGVLGTGGEIHMAKDDSGDVYHLFTTVGNYTFTPPAGGAEIRFLVVGGGGSSGGGGSGGGSAANGTGGGGGGGVIANDASTLITVEEGDTLSIYVGAGGVAAGTAQGKNGENSTLTFGAQTYTGQGGGGGGVKNGNGAAGGNGGGGAGRKATTGGNGTQPDLSGDTVGHTGGAGTLSAYGGAGGGGAGHDGYGSTGGSGGAGGDGIDNDITGEPVYYGGGGGGGCSSSISNLADATADNHGGLGGGGDGALCNKIPVACRGEDGLGGGGGGNGGCCDTNGTAGVSMAGGSGVVIIRYTPAGATGVDYLYVASELEDESFAIPPAGRYKADDLDWPQTLIPGEQSALTGEDWVCECVGYALSTSEDCGKNWSAPVTNAALAVTLNALDKSYRVTWLWETTYFNALIIENDLVGAPTSEPPVGSYLETELVFPMTLTPGEQTVVTGETAVYTCYGYALSTSADYGESWSDPVTNLGVEVALAGLNAQTLRYTWLWRESGYKVALGAAAEGTAVTISPARASGFYAIGETVTLTATSQDENKRFLAWTINGAVVSSEPIFEWVVEAAATIKAEFSGKWELVGTPKVTYDTDANVYLTDGNWEIPVQLINAAFPKELSTGSGNNSYWGRGYRKGRGELNFRSVEEDTGYRVVQLGNYSFACSSRYEGKAWSALGCTNITAIIAPDVTNVCAVAIGEDPNGGNTARSQLRRLVISPDAVLQNQAFQYAKIVELEPRRFPNQITLGSAMFQNCSNLAGELSFPTVAGVLGQNVFNGCTNLEKVRFGGGAVQINYNNIFANTPALTDLYFNAPFSTTISQVIFGNKSVVLHCELNGEYADAWETTFLAGSKVTLVENVEGKKAIAATYGVNWRAVVGTYLDVVNVCPIVDSSYKGGLILILK